MKIVKVVNMGSYKKSWDLVCPKCHEKIENGFEFYEDMNEEDQFEVVCNRCNHVFYAYYTVELLFYIYDEN